MILSQRCAGPCSGTCLAIDNEAPVNEVPDQVRDSGGVDV